MTIIPLRTNLIGLCLASAVLTAMTPCRGADPTLSPEVKEAIAAVRNSRAGVYGVFESSTLGTTASPAEYAAAQRKLILGKMSLVLKSHVVCWLKVIRFSRRN